jgi:hypothetical protein
MKGREALPCIGVIIVALATALLMALRGSGVR